MKKTALQTCSLVGLVVMIAVVSGNAQAQYRTHIPFDFTIGQKIYRAGDYCIDSITPFSSNPSIAIRDTQGRRSHVMMVTRGEDLSQIKMATLVFNRFETQYYLAEIRTPGFIVRPPKSKSIAKERFAQDRNPQHTIVVLTKKN